ncbi:ABC transporter substrate-binding protein [Bradyrhizobium diazoefficiens]|uniref:ABC transporter substrate-binding protein n=1 Tax=Bradyrhizobium diazoefficiens TaxID=1355477 RepID=UPI00190AC8EB|nr:ABC transporter substrate-binding protein [Bradyrhizobium diazoefficiens]MBK3663098.1 ABC transporter substrate-binding protein [Bradyrhizobium diazoefficiens]
MNRRAFLGLIGSAVAWLPVAMAKQASPRRRIGILMARLEDDPEAQRQIAAFGQGLRDLDWKIGQSVLIETRWTVGDPERALALARELIELRPDVLIANATPSLIALRQSTVTIPMIFVSVADPVGQGFVPNLSHPGGNITGFSAEEASIGGKWLDYLKEVAPNTATIALLYNPDTAPYAPMFLPAMQAAAPRMKVTLVPHLVRSLAEIERAVTETASRAGGAVIVLPDSFMFGQRSPLISLVERLRLPLIFPIVIGATNGALLAYGIDRVDLFRRAADYADRILKGASPADLPVQQPTKFELAVNVKTAKALGLTVPQALLLSADEVIE